MDEKLSQSDKTKAYLNGVRLSVSLLQLIKRHWIRLNKDPGPISFHFKEEGVRSLFSIISTCLNKESIPGVVQDFINQVGDASSAH